MTKHDSGPNGNTDQLLQDLYDKLRQLARAALAQETPGTLQPTALVHEAYLRLKPPPNQSGWESHAQFLTATARVMREVLVDRARAKQALKRGGELNRVQLESEELEDPVVAGNVLALHQALERLAEHDPMIARLIELTYFGGSTILEAAEIVGVSERTARRFCAFGKAWLRREIAAVVET